MSYHRARLERHSACTHINATYGARGLPAALQHASGPRSSAGATRPQIVTTGDHPGIPASSTTPIPTANRRPTRSAITPRFWDDSLDLFGVVLAHDTGLNFVDPGVHNGLTGTMLLKGDHFQADGIPVVPINDAGTWDPYQVAEIIGARRFDPATCWPGPGPPCPMSDEIGAAPRCHNGDDAESVLAAHDEAEETTFVEDGVPVLCADCHGDPALGQTGAGSSESYLSKAIHGFHATQSSITCYRLPSRTEDAFQPEHGPHRPRTGTAPTATARLTTLTTMLYAGRDPLEVNEPSCVNCHTFVAEVDTGSTPVPRRDRPRRPGLPRLPRESPRPGPDDAR
ncbi:MAG: hypothetical protein M0C28_38205 [Candidatus Moduliflexus flocculans]|nr:hypothetical protein [Candidatus Moduliflexus flocculans]